MTAEIVPEVLYLHAPIAGDAYDPRCQRVISISPEGYSHNALTTWDREAQEREVQRIENYDKGVYPSPIQLGVPGAGSGYGLITRVLARVATAIAGRAVRKNVEAKLKQDAADRQSKEYEQKLRRSIDDHNRKMGDSLSRAKEQNSIEHLEQKERAGDGTMVA